MTNIEIKSQGSNLCPFPDRLRGSQAWNRHSDVRDCPDFGPVKTRATVTTSRPDVAPVTTLPGRGNEIIRLVLNWAEIFYAEGSPAGFEQYLNLVRLHFHT